MEDETLIKRQMEDSRNALGEKLETLEKQVAQTVQGAATAVTETVETIKDTVSTVKETVEDTVTAVKGSVEESVATVKDWMDIRAHVDQSPWMMTGGAVLAGFVLGQVFGKTGVARGTAAEPAHPASGKNGNGHRSLAGTASRPRRSAAPAMRALLSEFAPELQQLKSLALGVLLGTAREMIVKAVPEDVGAKIGEIVDTFTTKIGGQPIAAATAAEGDCRTTEGDYHDQCDPAKMGRPVGSTHGQGEKTLGQFDRR